MATHGSSETCETSAEWDGCSEKPSFSLALRTRHETNIVFADVNEFTILRDKVIKQRNLLIAKMTLLRQMCEGQLSELQKSKRAEMDALSEPASMQSSVTVRELYHRCETAERRLDELSTGIQSRREQVLDLEKERGQLLLAKEELADYSDVSSRSIVDFYRLATKVRWDFNAEPNKVVGFVAEPGHIATFDLDTNENSMFFITNKIWSLMVHRESC